MPTKIAQQEMARTASLPWHIEATMHEDDGGIPPFDPVLAGCLSPDPVGACHAMTILLGLVLDDSEELRDRCIVDDTARWAATSAFAEVVLAHLLAVLQRAVEQLPGDPLDIDPGAVLLTLDYCGTLELIEDDLWELIGYVRDCDPTVREGLVADDQMLMAAAALAMVCAIVADPEGASADGYVDEALRSCDWWPHMLPAVRVPA